MAEMVEERMMAEWAAANLPPGSYTTHLRLGQPAGTPPGQMATEEERALKKMTLPEADLVERMGPRVTIYEFAVWRPQAKLGQLLFYSTQLPLTPGYEDVDPEEIRLRIVTAVVEPRFREMAGAIGLEVILYRPPWLEGILASRRGRG